MRRTLRRLATITLGLFATYLVAGNLFLNTAIGPWAINRKPERFAMQWSHGLTWWPGFVALWNVDTRGHVRHVQWSAQASHARGRIALLPLLSRELRFPSIDARDVRGTVDRVEAEMAPPPARAGGWLLSFDRIATTSLRHARIAGFDIDASGGAAFGFRKQLRGGPMEVLPSQATLTAVRITAAGHELLRDAVLDARFAIARHLRADAPGLAKLALTDARLRIDGAVPGLAVELDPTGHWRAALTGGTDSGRLAADLELRRGRLQPGGRLDLAVPLAATRGSTHVTDTAKLHADVGDDDIRLRLDLPPPPEGEGAVHADLRLAGTGIELPVDARALLPRVSGTLDLDWHFGSLAWLGPLLVKSPWLSLEGAGRVQADLRVRDGRLEAGSRVDVPGVELAADIAAHRFRGRARAQGRLEPGKDGALQARVDLALGEYDVAALDAPGKPLMHGRDLRIELASAGRLDDFRESAHARLVFEDAEVPDLRVLGAWLPRQALSLSGGRARIGADLALDAAGRIGRGRVGVHGRSARVRFGAIDLSGDFDLDARIGGSDLAARHLDLDGTTLRLRKVKVVDAGRTAGENWWASIALPRGRIEATKPFEVDARVDIGMQNVGLLLALFTRHRDYPKWALRLVDAGPLHAHGRMRIDGSTLTFDQVEANNDRFGVKARLRLVGSRPRGDLLLRWRALGLGLEIDGERQAFHFLRAATWYEARPALLR